MAMFSIAKEPAPAVGNNPACLPFWRGLWLGAAGLLLLTLLVYIPSYQAGFIWDDDVIAGNPLLKNGWEGLRDIWFSIKFGDFCPVTATSFWIEWQIHGAMNELQHATNIVLQALNVVLLWRVLFYLRIPGDWLAAAVFAVHPVCVASVTWLAERKNTLSMFFYLLSLLFYLRSDQTPNAPASSLRPSTLNSQLKFYWLSFGFFLLALLSKSSVVILPVVLLLCAWWRCGKIDRRNLLRVMPFFIFAFAAGVVTLIAHYYYGPRIGVLPTGDNQLTRTLTGTRAAWFYFEKDMLPVGLTLHYARWKIDPAAPLAYLPGLAIVGAIILFWKFRQSWGRACLFGFGYFILALAPTLGVLNMAFLMMAQVADHLQYLALPGLIALFVGGAVFLLQRATRRAPQTILVFLFLLLVSPLALLSWQHQRVMANPEALWKDNIKINPTSWAAHNNLGGILFDRGQFKEAANLYREALKTRGDLSFVHVNMGRALFALGKTDEAVAEYSAAIRLDPRDFKAQNDLGVAMLNLGRTNHAISLFQKAVKIAPGNDTFFSNLARLYEETGQIQEAIQLYLVRLQRTPHDSLAHQQIGRLLSIQGRLDESLLHYKDAVRLAPASIEARFGLGEILSRQFKTAEAVDQWRQILKLAPDKVEVLGNLAWALATSRDDKLRNGAEAVTLAERARTLAPANMPTIFDLVAAAYAEASRFPEAIKTEEEAISLANSTGQKELAAKYNSRLNLYRAGKPYRDQ